VMEEGVEEGSGDSWHIDGRDEQERRLEVLEGGEDAAEGAGVGFGVDEFAVERGGAGRVFDAGGGDEEFGAGPFDAIEQVDEDGLAVHLEKGFRAAHAGAPAAGEDGEGDLFARGHGWGV